MFTLFEPITVLLSISPIDFGIPSGSDAYTINENIKPINTVNNNNVKRCLYSSLSLLSNLENNPNCCTKDTIHTIHNTNVTIANILPIIINIVCKNINAIEIANNTTVIGIVIMFLFANFLSFTQFCAVVKVILLLPFLFVGEFYYTLFIFYATGIVDPFAFN